MVQRNLRMVLGAAGGDLDRRTRKVFREGVKYYYDTFRIPALSSVELERLITVTGWEQLEGALARGKGAVMPTAHLGSPALAAHIVAARQLKFTTVVEPVSSPKLLKLMLRFGVPSAYR